MELGEVRKNALHQMAQQYTDRRSSSFLPISSIKSAPAQRRGRYITIVTAILAVAIAGVAVFYALAPHSRPITSAQTPPQIIPALDDLACEQDITWSPDGTQIGILGYQRQCPLDDPGGYAYWPGRVDVYSVNSRKLLAQIQPDSSIIAALHLQPPAGATPAPSFGGDTSAPVITYTHLLWSPDGKSLALSFFVNTITGPPSPSSPPSQTIAGLWIATSQGSNPRIFSHLVAPGECACGPEWDLMTGVGITTSSAMFQSNSTSAWYVSPTLGAPATTYIWGPRDIVTGTHLLNASTVPSPPPLEPVGEPDGGASFTIWQPGIISAVTAYGDPSQQLSHIPGAQTFSTNFLVWSPDGRYVLNALALQWRLQAPGVPAPAAPTLRDFELAMAPVLPNRDAALAALLQRIPPTEPHTIGGTAATVAWNPNGRLLAVALPPPFTTGQSNTNQYHVDIYASASGKKVAEITPQFAARKATVGSQTYLRWSPGGSYLLVFDERLGVVSLVGSDQLPKA